MPVSDRETAEVKATWHGPRAVVRVLCVISYCTWCGEPVLPGWFMIIQGLQHDIHGECKQAGQEDVENYIEEKNKTCRQKEKEELYQLYANSVRD